MNRRQFFKACGASALVVHSLTPGSVRADNPINYWMHDFDEPRWGEESILRRAMRILTTRIQNRRIWQNVYDLRANGRDSRYLLSDEVMRNSNLRDTDDNRRGLLRHQLYCLAQPNGPDDTEPPFANVHLRGVYEREDWLGRARLNLVTLRSDGNNIRQSGEFDVQLNRYSLGGGGRNSDPEYWAATIAHEMLHNLGHLHERGDYTDRWQINVLDNAVLCNGYYRNPRYEWRTHPMV